MWTATLAPDKATFEEFIEPVYLFMNETTDRIPMSDWVFTDKPEHRAFQARSVVGGYFIKMLEVGEKTGRLDTVFASLADYYAGIEEISTSVRSAVTYPAILLIVVFAVIILERYKSDSAAFPFAGVASASCKGIS